MHVHTHTHTHTAAAAWRNGEWGGCRRGFSDADARRVRAPAPAAAAAWHASVLGHDRCARFWRRRMEGVYDARGKEVLP